MMRKRIVTGILALSLALIPVTANAMSYRGNGYCCKTFYPAIGGKVTASVSYAANTSLLKDTVQCTVYPSANLGITARCCYNETQYKTKTLTNGISLTAEETKKNVSSTYTYGKLSLSGDTTNTLYADE